MGRATSPPPLTPPPPPYPGPLRHDSTIATATTTDLTDLLVPFANLSSLFGRRPITESRAGLLGTTVRPRYAELQQMMDAYRANPSPRKLRALNTRTEFYRQDLCYPLLSWGSVCSDARVVDGRLLVHMRAEVTGSSIDELRQRYDLLRAEGRLRPCWHLGDPLGIKRPEDFMFNSGWREEKFLVKAYAAGGFRQRGKEDRKKAERRIQGGCTMCCTDYSYWFFRRRAKWLGLGRSKVWKGLKSKEEYVMEIRTWHDLGELRSPFDETWIRAAAEKCEYIKSSWRGSEGRAGKIAKAYKSAEGPKRSRWLDCWTGFGACSIEWATFMAYGI